MNDYKDCDGNPISLWKLVRQDPDWAASVIDHVRSTMLPELTAERDKWKAACAVRAAEVETQMRGRENAESDLLEAQQERDKLRACIQAVSAIRDSIIGAQTVNWSEHVYPLVAALNEAGIEGVPCDVARENLGTLIAQRDAAIARAEEAEAEADRAIYWLALMVQYHGACVDDECPGDDSCDCPTRQELRWLTNERVAAAQKAMRARVKP